MTKRPRACVGPSPVGAKKGDATSRPGGYKSDGKSSGWNINDLTECSRPVRRRRIGPAGYPCPVGRGFLASRRGDEEAASAPWGGGGGTRRGAGRGRGAAC